MADPMDEPFGPGLTPEQMKDDPGVLERAMLRVRMRHQRAGDLKSMTFGDILHEARKEAQAMADRAARGEDYTSRFSLK